MATRNTIREYCSDSYYHVYNRGAGKHKIFLDAHDKAYFLHLLARHLDPELQSYRADGHTYDKYDIELVAYCLMGNHFHLFIYQADDDQALSNLLRSVSIAYTMYFNKRYKRSGTLFEGRFKAARVTNEPYFLHITRYIHLNPRTYRTYRYSSLAEYTGTRRTAWIHPERVLAMSPAKYLEFLSDYESLHELHESLKSQLAN